MKEKREMSKSEEKKYLLYDSYVHLWCILFLNLYFNQIMYLFSPFYRLSK